MPVTMSKTNHRVCDNVAKLLYDVDSLTLSEDAARCRNPPYDVVQCANVGLHKPSLTARLGFGETLHRQRVPAEVVEHVVVKPGLNDALTNLVAFVAHVPDCLQPVLVHVTQWSQLDRAKCYVSLHCEPKKTWQYI